MVAPQEDPVGTGREHPGRISSPPDGPRGQATAVPHAPGAGAPLPERIGEYRIIRKIGVGGMGVVFEAEQPHPRRLVALKVILGGRHIDEHHVRLFRREAQALARLKHPGIATIYELGRTDEGQHFFTMELVRGETLTQHIRTAGGGQKPARADVHRRLRLFLRVCQAVAYAHQRGVVHRDIKPANILVVREDSAPPSGSNIDSEFGHQIKILDFGLARITDADVAVSANLTSAGSVQGTLPYMSPEQVRGNPDEIDLRTDVYSLGVVLYEMLAGHLPLEVRGLSLPEAARVICETPPEPIGRTRADGERLDADIVTIILKTLEKDPARRYQSVSALADDIERFLANSPILARPPSAAYQVQKLVARHRAAFAGGAVGLMLVVVLAFAMTVQARRIAVARDKASEEAESARQVSEFLENLFQVSDPDDAQRHAPTAREILDRGAQQIESELRTRPVLQARLMGTIGSIYQKVGDYRQAERLLTAALASRKALLGDDHPDVADAEMRLGVVALYEGKADDALARLKRSLEIREQALPADDVDVGWSLYWLGTAARYKGEDQALARHSLERAASIFKTRLGPEHWSLGWCYNDLGTSYFDAGDYATARSLYERALLIKRAAFGDDHPDTALGLHALANAMTELKEYEGARRNILEAIRILDKVYGPNSDITANAYHSYGELLRKIGDNAGARQPLEQAVHAAEAILDPASPSLALYLNSLALDLVSLGQARDAEADFRRALSIREAALPAGDPRIAETLEGYSRLLRAIGRIAEAEPLELRAQGIRAKKNATGTTTPPH